MKIAVFLNNGYLGYLTSQNKIKVIIFTMEGDKILGFENETLSEKNINYLTLWCLSKRITKIYIQSISPTHRNIFDKLDISIKTAAELDDDYLYNTFILGNHHIYS